MKSKFVAFSLLYLVFMGLTISCTTWNPYLKESLISAKVIAHHQSPGKSSAMEYLIIETKEWGRCAIPAGPMTYSTFKDGETRTFSLRKMDCAQTAMENTFLFFGQAILTSIAIVGSGVYLFFLLKYLRTFFRARKKSATICVTGVPRKYRGQSPYIKSRGTLTLVRRAGDDSSGPEIYVPE